MKTQAKIDYIKETIGRINDKVLKDTKILFDNSHGANNYCLLLGDMTLKFNTYDDMTSAVNLLYYTLKTAIKEREGK